MKSAINIACCVDRGALTGLHIMLASLLHNLNADRVVSIFLVYEGLSANNLVLLSETIRKSEKQANLKKIEINSRTFSALDKFVGGHMTYARLFLAEFLDIDRVIYLDADLIVGVDIAELWDIDIEDKSIGAVSWQQRSAVHDRKLFHELGEDMSKPYFNAGVLLMDLKGLIKKNLIESLTGTASRLKGRLISHDQSLLNLCLYEEIEPLPRRFNTTVTPRRHAVSEETARNRTLHLVARPKPWDPLGKLNGQYEHYLHYRPFSALPEKARHSLFEGRNWYQVFRSFRAYLKCLKRI